MGNEYVDHIEHEVNLDEIKAVMDSIAGMLNEKKVKIEVGFVAMAVMLRLEKEGELYQFMASRVCYRFRPMGEKDCMIGESRAATVQAIEEVH